jgi:hypothetical protein
MPKLGAVNLRTPSELNAFRKPRLEAAATKGEDAKLLGRQEKFYMLFWRCLGWVAHVGFLLGLALLLAFAIKNMK